MQELCRRSERRSSVQKTTRGSRSPCEYKRRRGQLSVAGKKLRPVAATRATVSVAKEDSLIRTRSDRSADHPCRGLQIDANMAWLAAELIFKVLVRRVS
jgi:hypothetical protein